MYTDTQIHMYTCIHLHMYTDKQDHMYTGTQAHRYTDTQDHMYTGTQVHRDVYNLTETLVDKAITTQLHLPVS